MFFVTFRDVGYHAELRVFVNIDKGNLAPNKFSKRAF